MTPNEFIESMKAGDPPITIEEASLSDWVKTQWAESGQDNADLLATINQSDWAQNLLDHLKPRLHSALVSFLDSDCFAIGTIGNPTPDAYVKNLDSGYAIVFHAGMRDFIYRVARILATRIYPSGTEGDPPIGNEFHETARSIAEVFWWYQETGCALGPQYPIDDNQIRIANLLAVEAGTFLIAHEIGHIIADGLDRNSQPLQDLIDDISPSQLDEFTADYIGVQLVMELHNEDADRDAFNTPLQYAAVEFALLIYRGLEELGFDFHDSHPAAGDRIARIRDEMQQRCEEKDNTAWDSLSALARAIDSIFTKIIQIINEPGEYAEFFERGAQFVVSDLNSALDKCTGGVVPNYVEFYKIASELFGRGYSHKLLERVAQVAADFFAVTSSENNEDSMLNHEVQVRFQKFKLLFGYIYQHLNEPARTIFVDAFESRQHSN